jgi:hypothetical protein
LLVVVVDVDSASILESLERGKVNVCVEVEVFVEYRAAAAITPSHAKMAKLARAKAPTRITIMMRKGNRGLLGIKEHLSTL